MGPPVSAMAGTPALAAPMSCAGTVLSQPPTSTTASSGLERIISSTSIDMRLRYSIVVGFVSISLSEIVGNSSASPPAACTPRLTAATRVSKWRLQLTNSECELAIPITGRPEMARSVSPSERSAVRCRKPKRSFGANHRLLRSITGASRLAVIGRSR